MINWQQYLAHPERPRRPHASEACASRETAMPAEKIPCCPELDGTTLRIVPADTEAGQFAEANVVTITDGERTTRYVPLKAVPPEEAKAASDVKAPSLPEREKQVIARALGYALATVDALESQLGNFLPPAEERGEMQTMIEAIVSDDSDLERILTSTRSRVRHLARDDRTKARLEKRRRF